MCVVVNMAQDEGNMVVLLFLPCLIAHPSLHAPETFFHLLLLLLLFWKEGRREERIQIHDNGYNCERRTQNRNKYRLDTKAHGI